MANEPAILGITERFAWIIPPGSVMTDRETRGVSVVSMQRLTELGARLRETTDIAGCTASPVLLRFNLLNLSCHAVTVCGIGLESVQQEPLRCEAVPPVAIASGACYPLAVEFESELGSAAVQVQLLLGANERVWVSVPGIEPRDAAEAQLIRCRLTLPRPARSAVSPWRGARVAVQSSRGPTTS